MDIIKLITITITLLFTFNAHALFVTKYQTIKDKLIANITSKIKCTDNKQQIDCLSAFINNESDLKDKLNIVHADFKKKILNIRVNKY